MFVKGESWGKAGSCVAFPNLRNHRQNPENPHSDCNEMLKQSQVRHLYPRYWQVKADSRVFQVSAQAVRRVDPTWNWSRLDPFTFKKTETCVRRLVVFCLLSCGLKNLQLTTVCFIRGVRAVNHAVTLPVTMDTASNGALELTICTRSCLQRA